jgi:hypothetical protein
MNLLDLQGTKWKICIFRSDNFMAIVQLGKRDVNMLFIIKESPFHNDMARPQLASEGDCCQLRRVASNIQIYSVSSTGQQTVDSLQLRGGRTVFGGI